MRPDSLRELEDRGRKSEAITRGRFYSVRSNLAWTMHRGATEERASPVAGNACAWRRPANLGGGAHSKEETQAYSQAPYKSLQLYAPVPARFDAHFSVPVCRAFSSVDEWSALAIS